MLGRAGVDEWSTATTAQKPAYKRSEVPLRAVSSPRTLLNSVGSVTRSADEVEIGICLKTVRQLHSKIVIVDEQLVSAGSFNWLSADRSGKYARHETSLVYQGSHLSDEIEVITDSLKSRLVGSDR